MESWISQLIEDEPWEWIFSGIGVVLITGILGWLWVRRKESSEQKSPSIVASRGGMATSGNVSATASGNGSTAFIATAPVIINNQNPLVAEAFESLKQQLATYQERERDYQAREQFFQEQNKALAEAVLAIPSQTELPNAQARIEEALKAAAQGNPKLAESIFLEVEQKKGAEGQAANKTAAKAARHRGTLAFLHDTHKALDAYRRATELDPENAEGWHQLGHLLLRVGQFNEAETAYRKVESLGKAANDQGWLAATYSNLGNVYRTRGELDRAEAMIRKALELFIAVGARPQIEQMQSWLDELRKG